VAQAVARISSLTQYPIKSCGGMPLEHAEIDESGLRGDRLLFLIDENGDALSQRGLPRSWQRRLVRNFTLWGWITRPSRASVDRMLGELNLLDYATFRALFPDCEVRRERFLVFTKAFVAVRTDAS